MKNKQNAAEAQGAETKEPKLPSPSVCLKTMAQTIRRMDKLKMITPEELETMKQIQNTLVNRWIGGSLNL